MSGSRDLEAALDTNMSRSPQTNPPNLGRDPPQPPNFHPIIATMHEQELGKSVLNLIAAATFFKKPEIQQGPELPLIQILLSMGCVAIWNGTMLRKTHPRAASLVEQAGIALLFFALNVSLAYVVPNGLVWFPVLCFGFSIHGGSTSYSGHLNTSSSASMAIIPGLQ